MVYQISYGILDKIFEDKKYNFTHKCNTRGGTSGSPILNMNNKVIGIHKEGNSKKQYNKGTFLNYPIKEFIKLNNKDNKKEKKEVNNKNNYSMMPDMKMTGMMNNMNMMNQINMMDQMNMMNQMNMMMNNMYINPLNSQKILRKKEMALARLKKEFHLCSQDDDLKNIVFNFRFENGNLFIWRVTMIGPKKTPYEGGLFTIRISFPFDYPSHGPDFRFLNRVYHLNVDNECKARLGHISLNFLNEWEATGKVNEKPVYGVKQALFDIFCLFYNQNKNIAYDGEMGRLYRDNRKRFNEVAKEWTIKYAKSQI